MLTLGLTTPTGFMPNLIEGVDYRMTASGIAKPLRSDILALFKGIQRSVGEAANLFGMPGGIDVDGAIGSGTGEAVKFTIGKFTDDLRSDVSAGARDGDPGSIAKDARNVLGVLQEAIARKKSAPVAATPLRATVATAPFVIPAAAPQGVPTIVQPKVTSLAVKTQAAPTRFVSTLPDSSVTKRSSTLVFVGLLGAFLLAGSVAAVIVSKQ